MEMVMELMAAFVSDVPTLCALAAASRSGKRVSTRAMPAAVVHRFPLIGIMMGTDDVKKLYARCLKLTIPETPTYEETKFQKAKEARPQYLSSKMTYLEMIQAVIQEEGGDKGCSLPKLKKAMDAVSKKTYQPHLVRLALKVGINKGILKQLKGHYKLAASAKKTTTTTTPAKKEKITEDYAFCAEVTFVESKEVVAYPLELKKGRDLVLRTAKLNSWVKTARVLLTVTQKRTGNVAALYYGTAALDDDYDEDETQDLPLRDSVLLHHSEGPVAHLYISCHCRGDRLCFDFSGWHGDAGFGIERNEGLLMLENDIAFTALPPSRKKIFDDDDSSDDDDRDEEWYREEVFRRFPSSQQQLPYLSDAKDDDDFFERLYRQRSILGPDLRQRLSPRYSAEHATTLKAYIFGLQVTIERQTYAYRLKPKIRRSSGRRLVELVTKDDLDAATIGAMEASFDDEKLPPLQVAVMEKSTARIALLYDGDTEGEFDEPNRISYDRKGIPLIKGIHEYFDSGRKYPSFPSAHICPHYVPVDDHQKAHFSVSFVLWGPDPDAGDTTFSVDDTLTMLENNIRYPSL